ncbi:translation elongation factor eEF-3 like [Alphaentomopoxvirus acuprea]|uniref:Translation elongation factor eEF-3 like n=1 Tax=Alphaentomopoxvirus acuprea TaxID=62099 RepID=W6JLD1_9POXV|nr:translation elongation factor eEF-3 like [Anomala cuprea entomopoxvirus]BAO49436.1 translation elongation factor eEF-3 like [Anomala cuprea entomopoxvirus]
MVVHILLIIILIIFLIYINVNLIYNYPVNINYNIRDIYEINIGDPVNNILIYKLDSYVNKYIELIDTDNEKNIFIDLNDYKHNTLSLINAFKRVYIIILSYNSEISIYYMDDDIKNIINIIYPKLKILYNKFNYDENNKDIWTINIPLILIDIFVFKDDDVLYLYNTYIHLTHDVFEKYTSIDIKLFLNCYCRLMFEKFVGIQNKLIYIKCKQILYNNSFIYPENNCIEYLNIYVKLIYHNNNKIIDDNYIINPLLFKSINNIYSNCITNNLLLIPQFRIDLKNDYNNVKCLVSIANIIFDNSYTMSILFDINTYNEIINFAKVIKYYITYIDEKYFEYIILNSDIDFITRDTSFHLKKRNDFSISKIKPALCISNHNTIIYNDLNITCSFSSIDYSLYIINNIYAYTYQYWEYRTDNTIIPGNILYNNKIDNSDKSIIYKFNTTLALLRIRNIDPILREATYIDNRSISILMTIFTPISSLKKIIDTRLCSKDSDIRINNVPISKNKKKYYGSIINVYDDIFNNITYKIYPVSKLVVYKERINETYYLNIYIIIEDDYIKYNINNYPKKYIIEIFFNKIFNNKIEINTFDTYGIKFIRNDDSIEYI